MSHEQYPPVYDVDLEGRREEIIHSKNGKSELAPAVIEGETAATGKLAYYARKLDSLGMEARGIERVLPEERTPQSFWGLCLIWASAGLTLPVFTLGFQGPLGFFNQTFGQCVGIAFGAGALGSATSAYMATFGKKNGLRALVNSRYSFGYYGAMLMAFLNIITEGVFPILDDIIGGQALQTLSLGHVPLVVGIIITGVVALIIATGGYKFIHYYESMYAVAAPKFDLGASPEVQDRETSTGLSLSYAAVVFGASSGWIPVTADYYIYFPENTSDWKIFLISFLGIWLLPAFTIVCGAGYATALWSNTDWAPYANGSTSALIEYSLRPLGNVRYFFLFILFWSMIANNVFNLYSIGISMQLYGRWAQVVPRFIWTFLGSIVCVVIAIAGRNNLYSILNNLVAVIGYWTIIYFAILLEEHLFFRKRLGYDLTAWNDSRRLPVGLAAMLAFWVGAAGSIVGMSETWYVGPIGKMIGSEGGDLGIELGFGFAAIVYPLFRSIELKHFGR